MQEQRRDILRRAASRGKYAPLYNHLKSLDQEQWHASFAEIEALLAFSLPESARIHRPWWANQGESGGHSHALSWQMAGWKTSRVDLVKEKVVFVRSTSA